jgi:hypothetical protein
LEDIDKIDLNKISQSTKLIADEEYTWRIIAEKYSNVF